jgi:hypothetical protein
MRMNNSTTKVYNANRSLRKARIVGGIQYDVTRLYCSSNFSFAAEGVMVRCQAEDGGGGNGGRSLVLKMAWLKLYVYLTTTFHLAS